MPTLTYHTGESCLRLPFEGTPTVSDVLIAHGVQQPHPCGRRGVCGKCAARIEGGVTEPNALERKAGVRLMCQAVLTGDAECYAAAEAAMQIQLGQDASAAPQAGRTGVAACVDVGTTTVAVCAYDLASGARIGTAAARNPQCAVAADVMGRIGAAMSGSLALLQGQITDRVQQLVQQACGGRAADEWVVTGNTTMLYLLCGRDPTPLSRAPFIADELFGREDTLNGVSLYLPRCMSAFVGADITCAVLSSGMCQSNEPALLMDIGTNGEIALWDGKMLRVCSTAAGPAFEGAGISCGMDASAGAIDHVWIQDGKLHTHTIGDQTAAGICGSGLVDALAAFLALEWMDETGAVQHELTLGPVCLTQQDIRAVQLAKAAIAAGARTLLDEAGMKQEDVKHLYIAGGFGCHFDARSARTIGLIPRTPNAAVHVLGNAALDGARMLLQPQQRHYAYQLAQQAHCVQLGGSAVFSDHYIDCMTFEE